MIKPDVILTWGKHSDYPLFRYNLQQWRHYFSEVLIGLTDHGEPEDYTDFLVRNVDAKFKDTGRSSADWRNDAVRTMLEKSHSEWVLFLEQDFLIKDPQFFEKVLRIEGVNAVLYMEDKRIHPAFALMKRELVNRTNLDFAANPPSHDHFGRFFKEATHVSAWLELSDAMLESRVDFYHMAGLTQNYHCFKLGQPFYKEKEFLTYNHNSLLLPIEQPLPFRDRSLLIDQLYVEEDPMIYSFFPA